MGLKLSSIGTISSFAGSIGNKINISNITGGINLNNIAPNAVGSIKNGIENKLGSTKESVMSDLMSAIDTGDFESIVNNLNIDSEVNKLVNNMQSQVQSGSSEYDIEGQVSQMISGMGLDQIKFM